MDSLPPTGPESPTTPRVEDWAYFAPGELLADRYRIIARLGAGGMGEVYRADDLTLAQPVALKFLSRSASNDPVSRDRFRSEVRAARQVSHPHVCRVHDIGEHNGLVFLTMEFVDGEDLVSLLRRVGRLAEERAVVVARDLCSAVGSVHEQGLLHRDLKPANVMLDGRGKVKLTDFGIAALTGQADDVRSGTAAYQAPEVLAGREVSVRSDLYALGLVLYELFTGKPAFPATSREALQRSPERSADTPFQPRQFRRTGCRAHHPPLSRARTGSPPTFGRRSPGLPAGGRCTPRRDRGRRDPLARTRRRRGWHRDDTRLARSDLARCLVLRHGPLRVDQRPHQFASPPSVEAPLPTACPIVEPVEAPGLSRPERPCRRFSGRS